jgi:Fe-S-cluster containining protein
VKLTEAEIRRIAAFQGLAENEFIQEFTRLRPDRRGLALKDKPNGECVFLEGEECSIQSVKPQQCRDFPNLWNFPDASTQCRAVPHEVDGEEWRRRIREATGRDVRPDDGSITSS